MIIQISVGGAILAGIIFVCVAVMATLLIISERERKERAEAAERKRRKELEREFNRQMFNLEMYGDIHGENVIYLDKKGKVI